MTGSPHQVRVWKWRLAVLAACAVPWAGLWESRVLRRAGCGETALGSLTSRPGRPGRTAPPGSSFTFLGAALPPLRPLSRLFPDAREVDGEIRPRLASSSRASPTHTLLGRPLRTVPSEAGRVCRCLWPVGEPRPARSPRQLLAGW